MEKLILILAILSSCVIVQIKTTILCDVEEHHQKEDQRGEKAKKTITNTIKLPGAESGYNGMLQPDHNIEQLKIPTEPSKKLEKDSTLRTLRVLSKKEGKRLVVSAYCRRKKLQKRLLHNTNILR